jgi:hypothetical protein
MTMHAQVHVADWFLSRLAAADRREFPYRHWLLSDALPPAIARAIADLPVPPALIGETMGKRETNNSTRRFMAPGDLGEHPSCAALMAAFQSPPVIRALQDETGAPLAGSFLRIEYCQDKDGFWLEPHTDIGAKLFTMLVYLSDGPEAEGWGTDIYDGERRHLGAAPAPFDAGLIFVPASDTWHGFERRPIPGIRRSVIVNYVRPEWRSRHELAFDGAPVSA